MTVIDGIRAQAMRRPSHPAIRVDAGDRAGETISYAELVAAFEALAKELRSRGVAAGDRCGLVGRQGLRFIEGALGIMASGACFVPVSDDHRGAMLDAFCACARLHHRVVDDSGRFEIASLPDPGPVDGEGDRAFRALGPAYLRFTSGTTAERKGVILGHDAIDTRLSAANRVLEIGPEDRVLWLLPMAHHFVVSILLYLREGATIVLPSGSLAGPVLDAAARTSATVLYASPHHYRLLAKDASDRTLSSVRLAVSTAEGLRADCAAAFVDRFGFPIVQALGIIEVGLPVVNAASAATKPCAVGRPLPDYDVWLRAEDGSAVVPDGTSDASGEVCIRGPGLFDAYLEPWLPARAVLEPDGFRTGDQGWYDADGDLHLIGRRATRISMAGMKFFGEEVEAVLDAHPAIRRSRVFAREHAHLGEIPIAEFVPEGDAAPEPKHLSAWCRERLPSYKVPRKFTAVAELPMTDTGKLQRHGGD